MSGIIRVSSGLGSSGLGFSGSGSLASGASPAFSQGHGTLLWTPKGVPLGVWGSFSRSSNRIINLQGSRLALIITWLLGHQGEGSMGLFLGEICGLGFRRCEVQGLGFRV